MKQEDKSTSEGAIAETAREHEQDVEPSADPRMTIDSSVDERADAMLWPMPGLEVVIGALEGAKYFFILDWVRGYWQLSLHPDSQELFSFVTTPTRVQAMPSHKILTGGGVETHLRCRVRVHQRHHLQ
jgi:hypothetical protein